MDPRQHATDTQGSMDHSLTNAGLDHSWVGFNSAQVLDFRLKVYASPSKSEFTTVSMFTHHKLQSKASATKLDPVLYDNEHTVNKYCYRSQNKCDILTGRSRNAMPTIRHAKLLAVDHNNTPCLSPKQKRYATFGHNFGKCKLIFKIFHWQIHKELCKISTSPPLPELLQYLVKFRNSSYEILLKPLKLIF